MNKYLSIQIEPERLIGHLMKAIAKGEKVNVSASLNANEKENSPSYDNNPMGVAVWEKESKFEDK